MHHGKNRRRLVYGILFFIFTLIEVLIALFVHDSFIRPYLGDMLVVIVLCCFVRTIFPGGTQFLSLYVFLFASVIEVGQYFNYAALLRLDHIRFFRLLLGTTFSAVDLVFYGVGSALFFACENLVFSLREKAISGRKE